MGDRITADVGETIVSSNCGLLSVAESDRILTASRNRHHIGPSANRRLKLKAIALHCVPNHIRHLLRAAIAGAARATDSSVTPKDGCLFKLSLPFRRRSPAKIFVRRIIFLCADRILQKSYPLPPSYNATKSSSSSLREYLCLLDAKRFASSR